MLVSVIFSIFFPHSLLKSAFSPLTRLFRFGTEWYKDKLTIVEVSFSTLSQTTNFISSKFKEFADDNLKFNGNSGKFSEMVGNAVEKEEIACYEQFLLFLQCFLQTCPTDM